MVDRAHHLEAPHWRLYLRKVEKMESWVEHCCEWVFLSMVAQVADRFAQRIQHHHLGALEVQENHRESRAW